jgi:uncharacterized protein
VLAVALYTLAPDQGTRIPETYPRHRAYLDGFQADTGDILLIGPLPGATDGPGSMAVFRTRAGAERFCAGDPFVVEGIVGECRILDWPALDFIGADPSATVSG